jgi:vancomycin permeability regulator SanA
VREAIRREQGEPAPPPPPPRRDEREYGRYEEDEPPRREVREYERREYREPAPQYREPAPNYREPGPAYVVREPGPVYSDRESEPSYPVRPERPSYSVREPEPYSRREPRTSYPAPEPRSSYAPREAASGYTPRESAVRQSMRDRPQRRDDWPAEEEREDSEYDQSVAPAWFAVTRATACFLGCVTLLNLLGEMRFAHFSAAAWWIDLHFLPKSASRGLLAFSAALWIAFALFPRANGLVRRLGALCTLGLLGAAGWTVFRFYRHDHAGQDLHTLPIPLALHVAALLAVVLPGQLTGWWERTNFFKDFLFGGLTLATCAASFPLAHFLCVGQLDDRAASDVAAVVAGRSDTEKGADGKSTSNPLQTACQLYREGQIKKILLIGRPNESGTPDETAQVLRRAALAEGVAEADLLTPPAAAASADSRTALADAAKFLDEQKLSHVLVVARFFEVPRIRLSFERAGLDIHSAPLREDVRPAAMRPVLAREAAALWMCYLQPLL